MPHQPQVSCNDLGFPCFHLNIPACNKMSSDWYNLMFLHFQILPVAASAMQTVSSFFYEKWCFMWFYKLLRSSSSPWARGEKKWRGKFSSEVNRGCEEIGVVQGREKEDVERRRWKGRGEYKERDRWAVRRKERWAEERRNQRHNRGHDANPLRSLETPANVTVRALGESRGFVWSRKRGNTMEGMLKQQQ